MSDLRTLAMRIRADTTTILDQIDAGTLTEAHLVCIARRMNSTAGEILDATRAAEPFNRQVWDSMQSAWRGWL